MFMIDIAGLKILYTGDYSREEDRHLVKAELPPIKPDVLIVESTFGVHTLEARETKEARFTNLVHTIIKRGGHVLMPTFALGRAQELLLILDEYWKNHPDLHNVPIYYASSLARKSMAVYQTYIHTMNANIRNRFAKRDNPFIFSYVFRSATLHIHSFCHPTGIFHTWVRTGVGKRRSQRVPHPLSWQVQGSFRVDLAASSWNLWPLTPRTGS